MFPNYPTVYFCPHDREFSVVLAGGEQYSDLVACDNSDHAVAAAGELAYAFNQMLNDIGDTMVDTEIDEYVKVLFPKTTETLTSPTVFDRPTLAVVE